MIGGLSYRVAHPPFVVVEPRRSTNARAPPRVVGPRTPDLPLSTPKG
jgi:hypothetical protein